MPSMYDAIKTPTPEPVAPVPHRAPAMTDFQPPSGKPIVWRPGSAEIDDIMAISWPSIHEKWPLMTEEEFVHLCRRGMSENRLMLFRTENMVGLYEAENAYFHKHRPVVREIFHRARQGWEMPELLALVEKVSVWASSIDSSFVVLRTDSNVSTSDFMKTKRVTQRSHVYLRREGGE